MYQYLQPLTPNLSIQEDLVYIMYRQLYIYELHLVYTAGVGVHHVPMTLSIYTTPCLYSRGGCTSCTNDFIYIHYTLSIQQGWVYIMYQ